MADEAALWSTEGWREEATWWLDQALVDAGMQRTGEVTQPHLEPWSTVLTATTTNGRVWLKAMVSGTRFEITLYDLLVRVAPEHVLHPIASDREQGWLLLPDGGPSFADRFSADALVEAMVTALPQYASIQIALSGQADKLLEMGLSDLRPPILPKRYRHALARFDGAVIGGLLARLEADYLGWGEVVEGSPLPATVDYNDLHPWNILGVEPAPADGTRSVVWDGSVEDIELYLIDLHHGFGGM